VLHSKVTESRPSTLVATGNFNVAHHVENIIIGNIGHIFAVNVQKDISFVSKGPQSLGSTLIFVLAQTLIVIIERQIVRKRSGTGGCYSELDSQTMPIVRDDCIIFPLL